MPPSQLATQLDNTNESIILALSKMGVYMERDKKSLSKLSPEERKTRLQKALDRTVETCCIFPLLFAKHELGKGKLTLLGKPRWKGWGENKASELCRRQMQSGDTMKGLVETMGKHSIWGPMRMGRYSVTESAQIQGASIRRLADVPEMETLQMRWLSIVTPLDMFGTAFTGQYWAITNIPAYNNADNQHMPLPPASQAVMAVQPIEVLEIQLPEPIDTVENESASAERAMHEAGYTGNTNRQAIPVIVVRYATSLPGLGKVEDVRSLIAKQMSTQTPNESYITPAQHAIFSRLLESNSRRLSTSDIKRYQSQVSSSLRKCTNISFLSPFYCPSPTVADEIELGRSSKLACAVCKEVKGDVKLFFCSACSGVAYCSSEHQTADWPAHKIECRLSKSIPKGTTSAFERVDPSDPKSAVSKILFPLPEKDEYFDSGKKTFLNYDNPMDRIKPARKKSQRAKTIYGPGERFLVRARWGGHAKVTVEQRRTLDWTVWGGGLSDDGMQSMVMNTMHILDRTCSVSILTQRMTGSMKKYIVMKPNLRMGGDTNDEVVFDALVDIIKVSEPGKSETGFFWCVRRGDCIEIDLVDIPDQSLGW